MKKKISSGIILLLLAFFVEGLFSFIDNPKLEKELLNELSILVSEELDNRQINKNDQFLDSLTDSSTIVVVTRVVDADTVEISTGEKVRYIGINAPETKHPTKDIECFGEIASLKNKELVEDKEVRLEKDVSEVDRYGRLLRYVYVTTDDVSLGYEGDKEIFVNEYLVREGYAKASSYPPDIKYQELFKEAESEARELEKGLWGEECR